MSACSPTRLTPTLPPRRRLWMALLAMSIGLAAPAVAAPGALDRLLQSGEVACEPALPVFCANIHVSCVGPSSIKSFRFRLRAAGTRGAVESNTDDAGVAAAFSPARVEWGAASAYVILRPPQGNGYVKLLADGTYSFRHYGSSGALMSRGECL
jgi:hypothetical protein